MNAQTSMNICTVIPCHPQLAYTRKVRNLRFRHKSYSGKLKLEQKHTGVFMVPIRLGGYLGFIQATKGIIRTHNIIFTNGLKERSEFVEH